MPTIRQRKAAKRVEESIKSEENPTGAEILESIGYSKSIAKNPKMIFESEGFKEALKEVGFSLEAADMTVAKILRTGKEENKLKASDQIYKRLDGYKSTGAGNQVIIVQLSGEVKDKYAINSSPIPDSQGHA